jgi:serine/threonine protein kinase
MQLVRDNRQFDRKGCLRAIRRAVEHLHKLGLIHGDLTPSNILSNGEDFVVGDFDSCTPEGNEFGLKAGTKGWTQGDSKMARRETDWYGVSKIEELLFPSKGS